MENQKHTLGPWIKRWSVNDRCTITDMRGKAIATIQPNENDASNADLISAAPDMLEALMNIENDNNSIPAPIWKMIQDAIKKATE